MTFSATAAASAPLAPATTRTTVAPVGDHVTTRWTTVRKIGFISMFVGGTALVVGGVSELFAFVFQGNATTLEGRSADCPSLSLSPPDVPANYDSNCQSAISYHSQALDAQSLALGLLAAGGVVLVTGIVLFVVGGNAHAPVAAFRVAPVVGPQFAGLSASGAF